MSDAFLLAIWGCDSQACEIAELHGHVAVGRIYATSHDAGEAASRSDCCRERAKLEKAFDWLRTDVIENS